MAVCWYMAVGHALERAGVERARDDRHPVSRDDQDRLCCLVGSEDEVTWWWPNQLCFEQILRKLGFREATLVGYHTGRVRPGGGAYKRAVIHARR